MDPLKKIKVCGTCEMVLVCLDSGLLKPSAVLGKGTGSGRHVSWDTSDSKPGQHTTETVLPAVELPVPDFSLPPPDTTTKGMSASTVCNKLVHCGYRTWLYMNCLLRKIMHVNTYIHIKYTHY